MYLVRKLLFNSEQLTKPTLLSIGENISYSCFMNNDFLNNHY